MKKLINFKSITIMYLPKKVCLSVFTILISVTTLLAQTESGIGVKGGLNYNANGDFISSINNTKDNPTSTIGYHVGVFGKIGSKVYFRPELIYTSTSSEYDAGDFKLQRIDAPMLVGVKILGPLSVFAGPAIQYILNSDIENATIASIKNDFTVGLNFGFGLNLETIGIDLRYERGFTDNEATIATNNSALTIGRLDTRPNQLILSVSVKL